MQMEGQNVESLEIQYRFLKFLVNFYTILSLKNVLGAIWGAESTFNVVVSPMYIYIPFEVLLFF